MKKKQRMRMKKRLKRLKKKKRIETTPTLPNQPEEFTVVFAMTTITIAKSKISLVKINVGSTSMSAKKVANHLPNVQLNGSLNILRQSKPLNKRNKKRKRQQKQTRSEKTGPKRIVIMG